MYWLEDTAAKTVTLQEQHFTMQMVGAVSWCKENAQVIFMLQ